MHVTVWIHCLLHYVNQTTDTRAGRQLTLIAVSLSHNDYGQVINTRVSKHYHLALVSLSISSVAAQLV